MTRRVNVTPLSIGRKGTFLVQGKGNIIDVVDKAGNPVKSTQKGFEGTILKKKVFNLRANSAVARQNERTHGYLMAGLKAEKSGTPVLHTIGKERKAYSAHDLFNAYLNSCQMSFGVLLPLSATAAQLDDNVEITAVITEIETEKGKMLSIDPSTISLVKAEVFEATSFNLDDLLGETPKEEKKPAGKKGGTKGKAKKDEEEL